jgi:putative Holliday junction resolvase
MDGDERQGPDEDDPPRRTGASSPRAEPTGDGLPRKGRLVGVDYGTVRIGLAITDPDQMLASPLEIYQRRNERLDGEHFRQLVTRELVAGFVVGLPIHLDGGDSRISIEATAFGNWLRELVRLPVIWHDERYTSSFAEEIFREVKRTKLQKKRLLDKLAAQILLTHYLQKRADRVPEKNSSPFF